MLLDFIISRSCAYICGIFDAGPYIQFESPRFVVNLIIDAVFVYINSILFNVAVLKTSKL
jgi:hypothetical protein